ncbi:MAG TPA: PEP-CTERM sorting domain-containing protein [Gemmatimonas sp.]|uniref:PEP-CTERM sorting domain-containing protein n=1 Tax=Gemmatimonas sp. TaxID=1962908 RepID=UPI002ED95445
MNRFRTIAAALTLIASSASAQAPVLGTVTFTGDQSNNGTLAGYNVAPYLANLSGFNAQFGVQGTATLTNAIIWCVDFTHYTNSSPDQYFSTAFSSNLGGVVGNGDFSKTRAENEVKYQQAAWLIEQYDVTKDGLTGNVYNAKNIQGTIWNLFGAGISTSQFTTLAIGDYTDLTRDWYVLSDNDAQGEVSNQEYLTSRTRPVSVPEPSAYLLMGSGLIALGFARRRRSATSA